MDTPEWITIRVSLAIHREQLAEHGGLPGIRDQGGLESALNRPINLFYYGGGVDLATLAGAYAFGIARNHPFADGNKRTSFVVSLTFLAINSRTLRLNEKNAIDTWLALAAGTLDENGMVAWFRQRILAG